MEKVLNQEEIDAMVRLARGGGSRPETAAPALANVEPWDVRRAGQIGREQLQAIMLLHESFARNLTHSLGAYLRVVFAATLVSAEHLTFREFLQRIPETTYLASCRLGSTGLNAALQLDLKVAFPIIDLLLGGEGKGMASTREITEIEEQILDSVARIVCRELGIAWQALALEVGFEERLEAGQAQRLMAPEEKILSLSFEATMPEVRGGLNLVVPATVSNALLRKISADWSHRRPRVDRDARQGLMRRLLDCPFDLELGAQGVNLSVGAMAQLAPGQVLAFSRPAAAPASLLIAGVEMFRALPVRCEAARAAKILGPVRRSPDDIPRGNENSKENSK
ncbi:MAG: flagellar motor switch protein FliM [Candidatus Sulfotelmatobacter sp.]